MSHPRIPDRPYNTPPPPNRAAPQPPKVTQTNESTAIGPAIQAYPSSAWRAPSDAVIKSSTGIVNFATNINENMTENNMQSVDALGNFKKFCKLVEHNNHSFSSSSSSTQIDGVEMNLEKRALDLGVKFFLVAYSTLNSDCRTCLVPTSSISDVQKHGCHLATAMFFKTTGADPDMFLVPDPKTFVQLPWKPEYAWVQGNMICNGQPAPQCPRTALINLMTEAKKMGLVMKSGIEPEFTLLNKDGSDLGDPLDSKQPMSLHDPLSIMRVAPLLSNIHDTMKFLGWKPYQIDHEATKCQYEINFDYADALTTADRHCFMKFMMKQLAEEENYRITFMAVPFGNLLCANGMHINVSLWSDKEMVNIFQDKSDKYMGLSKTAYNFIGGLLDHVEEYCAILCPTVNSYKRLNLGSWCPNTITWGGNNRTVMLRVPISSRVEHRLPDGSTNPYLAQAVILASGLDGIRKQSDPGPAIDYEVHTRQDDFKRVPTSLLEALDRLESSDFLRESLGSELVEGFVFMKRKEWNLYSAHLCEWEREYYVNC